MNWVEEFLHKNIEKNYTSDTNKLYLMKIIPMLSDALNIVNPIPGPFSISAVEYLTNGIREIRITFLKEKNQHECNRQENSEDVSEEGGTTGI